MHAHMHTHVRACSLAAEITRTNASETEVQRIKAKFGKKLWDVEEHHKQEVRLRVGVRVCGCVCGCVRGRGASTTKQEVRALVQ